MTVMKYCTSNIYEMNMSVNMRVNRMRNCLSELRDLNNENLNGCSERYTVLGYEKKRKYLLYTTKIGCYK
jgi:hypothetical protein